MTYHLNLALDNGVKPREISEIITHIACDTIGLGLSPAWRPGGKRTGHQPGHVPRKEYRDCAKPFGARRKMGVLLNPEVRGHVISERRSRPQGGRSRSIVCR